MELFIVFIFIWFLVWCAIGTLTPQGVPHPYRDLVSLGRDRSRLLRLSLIPIVNNFFILGVDFLSKMRYTICIESERLKIMRNLPTLPEATWQITFDNDSTIFIAGRDEEHARRVLENNKGLSRWRRTPECEWQIRTIKKIERVTWQDYRCPTLYVILDTVK